MDPGSHGATVVREDVADALLVLRAIIGRSHPAGVWAEVDRSVTALAKALVSGDGAALRYETARLELLGPERDAAALVSDRAGMAVPSALRTRILAAVGILEGVVPVTIYLSDGADHEAVESAVERLLGSLGLYVIGRGDPVAGSWFRGLLAGARSLAATDPVASALHAVDARLVLQQDAQNTALLMQNLGPLIASLQSTRDCVIRVGAFLVVKADWTLVVTQLTAEQQLTLDHSPQLAAAPQKILHVLGLRAAESGPEFPQINHAD